MHAPPGNLFTMFHFLKYRNNPSLAAFFRGSMHIVSPSPYDAPEIDSGYLNDVRDMAPMVWAYKKESRDSAADELLC